MPATYSYPGVYVEEIPSGVRTISGVSTADTAFVDVFARGPVDQATRITSWADFERTFGGLDPLSEGSYALQQFYLNGGQIAWVIRVDAYGAAAATLDLDGGSPAQKTLTVEAQNPGAWGNSIQVAVVSPTGSPNVFNLVVREVQTVNNKQLVKNVETHRNLTMGTTDTHYALHVVNANSSLVKLTDAGLGDLPTGVTLDPNAAPPEVAFRSLASGADGSEPAGSDFAEALIGDAEERTGMYALNSIDPFVFNILCLPAVSNDDIFEDADLEAVIPAALTFCDEKRAFLIVDIPKGVNTPKKMTDWMAAHDGLRDRNAAVYFPRLIIPDQAAGNRDRNVGASGTMAGVYGRTDSTRGVWKAPAGTDADLRGARLEVNLTDLENGGLNPLGINTLRTFPIFGPVAWGARTLDGADQAASEWKYISVRRTALYIEESLYEGLKWVVFEGNDEPLWAQIRLNVGAFMRNLFRQGAFQGKSPADAYFVKCDKDTTTQNDIDRGIVNILVGFAPLKPAEFVVLQIQQIAGQIQT